MKLPLARLTSNLVPFGAASRVVLNSETRIRMSIMIEPWSCGELASKNVLAVGLHNFRYGRIVHAHCKGLRLSRFIEVDAETIDFAI